MSHRMTSFAGRALAVTALALTALTGCAAEVAPEEETAASAEDALSVADWSATTMVGLDQQGAYLSGTVATLGTTTYMVHSGQCSGCNELWWTRLTPDGWTDDVQIPNQLSANRVSLAPFNGYLYMFHSGNASPSQVWYSRFDPSTQTWSPNVLTSYSSKGAPAIAEYHGALRIVGVSPSDNKLWMATMSAIEGFTSQTAMPGHYSASPVSVAVYNDRLYMAHRAGSTTNVVYNSFDGASWGTDLYVNAAAGAPIQAAEPSLATLGGRLHLVHVRPTSGADWVWWTSFNGATWDAELSLGNTTFHRPSLAPGGGGLVMVTTQLGADGNGLTAYKLMSRRYLGP